MVVDRERLVEVDCAGSADVMGVEPTRDLDLLHGVVPVLSRTGDASMVLGCCRKNTFLL